MSDPVSPAPSFWVQQYHGPRGPLADADDQRRAGLLHAFTGVGMVSILFFGVQLVARGNVETALMDGVTGTLMGVNLLAFRWHRQAQAAAWLGLGILAVYLLLHVITGGDQGTGYLWTVLFPPAAAFLLGFWHGLLFLVLFLVSLVGVIFGWDVFAGTGLPESFPSKLMGALVLVSAFSFAFERARQRAQAELISARDQAQRSAHLKGEFLANMSHEVRTPLNGIIGLTDLMLEAELPEQQREHVQLAGIAARQLLDLLNDILDLSKAGAGKLEIDPQAVALAPTLGQIVSFHQPRAETKGLRLELKIGEGIPARLLLDPIRVRQVLNNLLANALKFTDQGRIALHLSLDREANRPRQWLLFEVVDTGIGVPAQWAGAIFDDFVQADGSTARRFGGTGLGLAISKHLVERMGGQIGYEAGPDGGSVFWFRLPVFPVKAEEPASPVARPAEDRSGRVLVVDDNQINTYVLCAMLENLGLTVEKASSGRKALERWAEGSSWDLVMMDIQMPDMDGLEVTRAIRSQERPPARVPIVAVTAHAMEADRQRCLDAGMDAYLSKPVREADLQAVVARWLPVHGAAKPDADSPAVLDRERLSISTRDDPTLEGTLRQMFLDSTPEMLTDIATAGQASDFEEIERMAHKLRGSCSTLGAKALEAAASELESAARESDGRRIESLVELARLEYGRVHKVLVKDGPSRQAHGGRA